MVARKVLSGIAQEHLIGFRRSKDNTIEQIVSSSQEFESRRYIADTHLFGALFGSWNAHREAHIVPLSLEKADVKFVAKSEDYGALPAKLRKIFDSHHILRTSLYAQYGGNTFSALMYATNSDKPMGRTGVLLYDQKPVVVKIGDKEFIVEIKGVGVPNGNNTITDVITASSYFGQGRDRWGGLEVDDGEFEYDNLELLRKEKAAMFEQGNSPRAALLVKYDGKLRYHGDNTNQAYVLRLAPASVRSSFSGKDGTFNPFSLNKKARAIARDLARQFVELLRLDSVLVHTSAHPENLVLTNDGYKFTDYADVRQLADLVEPHRVICGTLAGHVGEIPGITAKAKADYCKILSKGLGISGTFHNPWKLAEKIWREYVAPRVFALRQQGVNASFDHIFTEMEAMHEEGEHYEPLETIDERIRHRAHYWLEGRQKDVRNAQKNIKEIEKTMSQLATLLHDPKASRKFFFTLDDLSDQQMLKKVMFEYQQTKERMEQVKAELKETAEKVRLAQSLAKKYIGNIREFAKADPGVVPGITTALYYVEEHLQNELDLLSVIPRQQESILAARANLRKVRTLEKDPYLAVERLRDDPQYLHQMATLPYHRGKRS